MMTNCQPPDVAIVGSGMYTEDVILPSVYHLQRSGGVAGITVCARHARLLRRLAANAEIRDAFPGQEFAARPPLDVPDDEPHPNIVREVLPSLPPGSVVIVAVPDHVHAEVVAVAMDAGHHVVCVKPLVLTHAEAVAIGDRAHAAGLLVGVEYHKRFDTRSLMARKAYADGRMGEFVMGEARLHEPYFYRRSNFQNWFTTQNSDPFVYVGCHYVDLVCFITGLRPTAVSVQGVRGRFPNGNEGFMWSSGRVTFENGALLTVTNSLGYPEQAAGSNDQGLIMYGEADGKTGMIHHQDQHRGVAHATVDDPPAGGSSYRYVSPDFFRLVPWTGAGFRPVGYGYESIAALVGAANELRALSANVDDAAALARRQERLDEIDARGLLATPRNSAYNERVVEAARESILNDGRNVPIPTES